MARWRSAIVFAFLVVVIAMVGCGGHAATPAAIRSLPPPGPIASKLPPGVCAPTYAELNDPNATRIEAKLVSRDTLMKSDPDFRPTWHTATKYFWIVADVGTFIVDGPMPPGATPAVLHNAISYVEATIDPTDPESVANPCRGIGVTGSGSSEWPGWFDQMTALVDVKIR